MNFVIGYYESKSEIISTMEMYKSFITSRLILDNGRKEGVERSSACVVTLLLVNQRILYRVTLKTCSFELTGFGD